MLKSMKFYKILFLILSFCFTYKVGNSQEKVALEQVQVFSTFNPDARYWHLPVDISNLEKALDSGIFKTLHLERIKQNATSKKILTKQNQVGKISINWEATRDIPFHAYLELYELDPETTYLNKLVDISASKKDSVESIWAIVVDIFNQKHEKVFQKTIMLGMMPVKSVGIGYEVTSVATTPIALFQAIAKGISYISPDANEMEFMEAKVPKAYATDNYWMPLLHNTPRTLFDTANQFISYNTKSGQQLLRIPTAPLYKIDLKNKADNYPLKDIVTSIKKYRSNTSGKEYYQVIQPLRDVQANKDYIIKSYLEFNPQGNGEANNALIFIPEIASVIYDGRDSIGMFSVKEKVSEKDKFLYPDNMYNGYDSLKKFEISDLKRTTPIIHEKVIQGNIYNHPFAIQFDNEQSIKTILFENKIVMIIDGDKKPYQMVVLSNSLTNELKNLLLLIAFGELFQSPK